MRTRERLRSRELQADPVEASMPFWAREKTRASPSTPLMETFRVLGSLGAPEPLTLTSRIPAVVPSWRRSRIRWILDMAFGVSQ